MSIDIEIEKKMESKNIDEKAEKFKDRLRELFEVKHPELKHDINWLAKNTPPKFKREWGGFFDEELKNQNEVNEKNQIIAELTDSLQRLQAEFENYKKRVDKEKEEFVKYAKAGLIQRLLPTLDTFKIALKSTKDNEKFVKGMEMVYAQFVSTLRSEGLKPIEAIGKKFDHYLHEVMLKEESDKDEGIVLEELQKGYMLNDKVLRHSKVKISEKSEKEEAKKEENSNEKVQ